MYAPFFGPYRVLEGRNERGRVACLLLVACGTGIIALWRLVVCPRAGVGMRAACRRLWRT